MLKPEMGAEAKRHVAVLHLPDLLVCSFATRESLPVIERAIAACQSVATSRLARHDPART